MPCAGLTQQEPLSCSPQAYTSDLRVRSRDPTQVCRDMYVAGVPVNANCRWHIDPLLQPEPTPVSAQLVMFTEAWTVAANPFLCGVKGNTVVGMCSPA